MSGAVNSSPYSARPNSVAWTMRQVLFALTPGVLAMVWFFGWGVLINCVLASLFAVAAEAAVMRLRGRPIRPAIGDLSAVVTAVLFAIAVPPTLPWWLTLLGILFAIVIVKQLYGGLGYNPFNPAMAGYVFLLISYPVQMTNWVPPDLPDILDIYGVQSLSFLDSLRIILQGPALTDPIWDSITAATPLDQMRTQLDQNQTIEEIRRSVLWGDYGGRGWEWVANWFLLGGIYLLVRDPVLDAGCAADHGRHVLDVRSAGIPVPCLPPVQRCRHRRRLLYRHRPGQRLHDAQGTSDLRCIDRRAGVRDTHLGRLPGCGRIRGLADEHRRPHH